MLTSTRNRLINVLLLTLETAERPKTLVELCDAAEASGLRPSSLTVRSYMQRLESAGCVTARVKAYDDDNRPFGRPPVVFTFVRHPVRSLFQPRTRRGPYPHARIRALLADSPDGLTTAEICGKGEMSQGTATLNLRRLIGVGEVTHTDTTPARFRLTDAGRQPLTKAR